MRLLISDCQDYSVFPEWQIEIISIARRLYVIFTAQQRVIIPKRTLVPRFWGKVARVQYHPQDLGSSKFLIDLLVYAPKKLDDVQAQLSKNDNTICAASSGGINAPQTSRNPNHENIRSQGSVIMPWEYVQSHIRMVIITAYHLHVLQNWAHSPIWECAPQENKLPALYNAKNSLRLEHPIMYDNMNKATEYLKIKKSRRKKHFDSLGTKYWSLLVKVWKHPVNNFVPNEGIFDSATNSVRTRTIYRVEMNRGFSKAKLCDKTQDFRVGIRMIRIHPFHAFL